MIQNLGDFIGKEHHMDLVALDLVEVAPDWDIGNITALGAYFISEKTKEKQSPHQPKGFV